MTSERAGGAARCENGISAGRTTTGTRKPLAEIVSVSIKPATAVICMALKRESLEIARVGYPVGGLICYAVKTSVPGFQPVYEVHAGSTAQAE